MAKTGRESFKFMLRLPDDLRDHLRSIADQNGRSMTAEIVARLEGGIDRDQEGLFRIWLPGDLRARIEDRANRDAIDPNLLIVDALEKAFPPALTLEDKFREFLADGARDDLSLDERVQWNAIAERMVKALDEIEANRAPSNRFRKKT